MYEKPKDIKRNHLRDTPVPAKICDAENCNRPTVVFFKEHDISRCAFCYQQDLDVAGKSANPAVAKVMIENFDIN